MHTHWEELEAGRLVNNIILILIFTLIELALWRKFASATAVHVLFLVPL